MCKLLYPFVPDNMRSPEGIQLLMSEPEVQDQLETALQQALKVAPLSVCLSIRLYVCLSACVSVHVRVIGSNWGQQDSVSVACVWSKYIPTARIEKIPAQLMHEDSHGSTQFAVIGYVFVLL